MGGRHAHDGRIEVLAAHGAEEGLAEGEHATVRGRQAVARWDEQLTEAPGWRACPELELISKLDSSTASKALAGTVLSSLAKEDGQLESEVPQKCQLGPLSARINPYCCKARRTTWAWGE